MKTILLLILDDLAKEPLIYMKMHFTKMNGYYNDFLIIDAKKEPVILTKDTIIKLSNRRKSVGFDQLILLRPSKKCDYFMQIFNASGEEAEMCGNALRCIGLFSGKQNTSVETMGGKFEVEKLSDRVFAVNMGSLKFDWQAIPLSKAITETELITYIFQKLGYSFLHAYTANIGNPHLILLTDQDLEGPPIEKWGPILEYDTLFPKKINVSFCKIINKSQIKLRVWERGAGATLACGTAACATVACFVNNGLTNEQVSVIMPGGNLEINYSNRNNLIMTGEAEINYHGEVVVD